MFHNTPLLRGIKKPRSAGFEVNPCCLFLSHAQITTFIVARTTTEANIQLNFEVAKI